MGLKKNDTTKILLLGIGAICILAAGIMFRTWRYYSRKMMMKAMYIRRIGCFTTPPHGDPEAGEVAWSVAGRVRVVLCSFKPGGLLSVFTVSWITPRRVLGGLGKGSTLSLGVSLVLPWWGFQVLITFWRSLRFCIFIFGVFWRVEQFLYYGSFFLPPHTGEDLVRWIWFSNLCK